MLRAITLISPIGDRMELSLSEPEKSGVVVENVDGLGPPPASVNMTPNNVGYGCLYDSSHVQPRVITITLGYHKGSDPEKVRSELYKYLVPGGPVRLRFRTDFNEADIVGYVEKYESVIFGGHAKSVVSLTCPSPFFEKTRLDETLSSLDGGFVFPFMNNRGASPELVFEERQPDRERKVMYPGNVSTGFEMDIIISEFAYNVTILNRTTGETLVIKKSVIGGQYSSYVESDSVFVSTRVGNRRVLAVKGTDTIDIMGAVGFSSAWPRLVPGVNEIVVKHGPMFPKWTIRAPILLSGL